MTDIFSLKNKTAIVTGALGLLGKKHCEALAFAGANVVVADLDENGAAAFARLSGQGLKIGFEMDFRHAITLALDIEHIKNKRVDYEDMTIITAQRSLRLR